LDLEGRSMSARRQMRVLLVEDEAVTSLMLEDMLGDLGCKVVGPAATLAEAAELALSEGLAGAFLDIDLGGASVYPVADVLAARDVPFVFVSGYGESGIEQRYVGTPLLSKPIVDADLERAVERMRERQGPG
jgi:CheY-like chemotaxis protein